MLDFYAINIWQQLLEEGVEEMSISLSRQQLSTGECSGQVASLPLKWHSGPAGPVARPSGQL